MLDPTNSPQNSKIDLGSHYSMIITPADYNDIMTNQHLYIAASDNYIKQEIVHHSADITKAEIVELGCGPARLLPLISEIPDIHLTLVDADANFLDYGRKVTQELSSNATLCVGNVTNYQHPKPVNIFYSQGLHHHIAKGKLTKKYLTNIAEQLVNGGIYILSDEFLPDYSDESDREIKAIIWYAHIIDHALKQNFHYLAQEEAKTLIDDLFEGHPEIISYKSEKQLAIILNSVSEINSAALQKNFASATDLAEQLLAKLKTLLSTQPSGNPAMDLSRKDFKICEREFKREVAESGLVIEKQRFFGIDKNIGGMVVYVLKKP